MKKRNGFLFFAFIAAGLFLMVFNSCDKNDEIVTLPTLSTDNVFQITQTTAICGGVINSNGGAAITACGVCWSASQNPTTNDQHTANTILCSFTSSITGLTPLTNYFIRAYASNSSGTAYGNEVNFTTVENSGTIIDYDGNNYNTITIGSQVWMKENLKTTHYSDGTEIPNITNNEQWGYLSTGAYSFYDNNPFNDSIYGLLYNWYAVTSDRGLCPSGWHVSSDSEWTILINYLGGESVANSKLKETGNAHWAEPNEVASNQSGFTALPGGYRGFFGTFYFTGKYGFWWSSIKYDSPPEWYRFIYSNDNYIHRGIGIKVNGLSVRCLKD